MTHPSIWKNYFDVVILPAAPVRDQAIALSRKLKKHGGAFVLGKRSFLPHISLYHVPVHPNMFARFARDVRDVASRSQGGALRLRVIDMALLMTDKPAWLRNLHLDVVNTTLKYFDGEYGAEEFWNIGRMPPKLQPLARRNLKQFGSPMIGRAFRPHITLTSFDDGSASKSVRLDFEPMTFDVNELAICELGPHHTCQRVVGAFQLRAT